MSSDTTVQKYDGKSFLVVNSKGLLRQVFVPVKLRCLVETTPIPFGAIVFADAIIMHDKYHWVYWINQKLYPHFYFSIQVNW